MSLLFTVQLWLVISALASIAGWTLSALGQLNIIGYTVFFAFVLLVAFSNRVTRAWLSQIRIPNWQKTLRRFRKPLPVMFGVLAILIFLGGSIYPPTNHTALTYRIPRVLQWLAHHGWFWIHTENYRMNDRSTGIEWLSAPLLLFTKSDRLLFLLNFIPYLLLPGLIYKLCRQLGVRARVASQWMWILPTGYSFLLQAGSAGNDTFPTVYGLAMMVFGFRVWKVGRVTPCAPSGVFDSSFANLWFSILSAALLVGAKPSNLPLLLPWAILIFPKLPLLKRRPAVSVVLAVVALVVSFAPTAALNYYYLHDWSGLNIERAGMNMKNPFVGVWGNALLLLLNNFAPPFFPVAGWWNQHALSLLPQFLAAPMVRNFEQNFQWLGELPTEDWSGIGFGVSVLAAVSAIVAFKCRRSSRTTHHASRATLPLLILRAVLITPWIALLAYCMKSGMVTAARLISPYYPLLLPLLILGDAPARVVRQRWWRVLVWGNFLLALMVLVLTPARPLWPAKTILARAVQWKPNLRLLHRAQNVYAVYADRSDPLAPVRDMLPPGIDVIGFVGNPDDMDISLWRPYGSRRVEHILVNDPPSTVRARGIRYAVVDGFELDDYHVTLDDWLERNNAMVLSATNLTIKVSAGPQPWYVVAFR